MTPELIKHLILGFFAILVIIAALQDLATFTISNWISAALALGFVPAALIVHAPLGDIGIGFGVGIGVLVLAAGMFAFGWIGGGDAKLMAAAALWVSWNGLAPFLVYTAVAGGALALALVALRSAWIRPFVQAGPAWTRRLATPGEAAPYGVAIAVGALAAFTVHPLA